MYRSSKTYGHDIGLSCCFRQWRAQSHCNRLHGYALSIHLEFKTDTLDERNWVVDFGSLKGLKGMLEATFDHTLVVADDDPQKEQLLHLDDCNLAKVIVLEDVGCEKFAEYIYIVTEQWLLDAGYAPRVKMDHVTVREHGANSATFTGDE